LIFQRGGGDGVCINFTSALTNAASGWKSIREKVKRCGNWRTVSWPRRPLPRGLRASFTDFKRRCRVTPFLLKANSWPRGDTGDTTLI